MGFSFYSFKCYTQDTEHVDLSFDANVQVNTCCWFGLM